MKQEKLSQSVLRSSLKLKQQKRETLLAKIEKTSARLERRKERLLVLEADIAGLEGQMSERMPVAAPTSKD
jgi:hypothetical protein